MVATRITSRETRAVGCSGLRPPPVAGKARSSAETSGCALALSAFTPFSERTTIWAPMHSPPAAENRIRAGSFALRGVASGSTFSDSSAIQIWTELDATSAAATQASIERRCASARGPASDPAWSAGPALEIRDGVAKPI